MTYAVNRWQELQQSYERIYAERPIESCDPHYRWILSRVLRLPRAEAAPRPAIGKAGKPSGRHPARRRLLDVACGPGWMLYQAGQSGLTAVGVDLAPTAVRLARRHAPRAHALVGDGERLPWRDGLFDYVTFLGSLEHYLHPEQGVREIARVLAPLGTAVLMLPNNRYLLHRWQRWRTGQAPVEQEGFERLLTRPEWRRLLESQGLRVVKTIRQNEIKPLFVPGTFKVKSLGKFLRSELFQWCCPMDWSYHFIFVCRHA